MLVASKRLRGAKKREPSNLYQGFHYARHIRHMIDVQKLCKEQFQPNACLRQPKFEDVDKMQRKYGLIAIKLVEPNS